MGREARGRRQEGGRGERVWCVGAQNEQAACSRDRTQHTHPAKPQGRGSLEGSEGKCSLGSECSLIYLCLPWATPPATAQPPSSGLSTRRVPALRGLLTPLPPAALASRGLSEAALAVAGASGRCA